MIKHLINILWTRKKKNTLLVIEIAISFVVLFLLMTLLNKEYQNYAHPIGFETKNVMIINLNTSKLTKDDYENKGIDKIYEGIFIHINSFNEVTESCEFDYSHSYSSSRNTTTFTFDGGIKFHPTAQYLSAKAVDFLHLNFVRGRHFIPEDLESSTEPIIINQLLYDKLKIYLDEKDSFKAEDQNYQIVGVINYYNKENDLADQEEIAIRHKDYLEWFNGKHQSTLFVRTKNDPRKIESEMVTLIEKVNPRLSLNVYYFEDIREKMNFDAMLPVFLMTFIALFLVCNIALGLYGVLWYNVSKRKSEIGIRRAMGASSNDIFKQIFSEVFILFGFGVLIGGIVGIQFPLLGAFNFSNTEYMIGAVLATLFVMLIIITCGYYPSKLATKVTPNEALQEL